MVRVYTQGLYQTIHINNWLCLYSELCHKPLLNVVFHVQSTMSRHLFSKTEATNEIKIKKTIMYIKLLCIMYINVSFRSHIINEVRKMLKQECFE